MHTDGCDFFRDFILRPHAGEARNAFGDHAQITTGTDERFFQLSDKINGANARIESTQIKDGIADELAGTVKSHVTAAVGLMQFHSIAGQEFTRSHDILRSCIAAQSDDRRMLQQEQRVSDASFFNQTDKRLLQVQRNGVIHAAEKKDIDQAQRHPSIVRPEENCDLAEPRLFVQNTRGEKMKRLLIVVPIFIVSCMLLGCSSSPTRAEAGEIIERSGVVYTLKPVQAKVELGHMNKSCGSDRDTVIYGLLQERGFTKREQNGDINLTDKGRDMLNRLKVSSYFRGTENGCNYDSYLLPLGENRSIEVTGILQPSDSIMIAKYALGIELNELGKDVAAGSAFCKKYVARSGGICPDGDLMPWLEPIPGKEGFAKVGEHEATLMKFDDGWRLR